LVVSLGFGVAGCGGPGTSLAPTPQEPLTPPRASILVAADAVDDGTTLRLKATAPMPQSPTNDVRLETSSPTLVTGAATAKYVDVTLQHRFQVISDAGTLVQDSGLVSGTSFRTTVALEFNTRYTWRVRGEYEGAVGPWSATVSFLTVVEPPPPTHQSPADGSTVNSLTPNLTIANSNVASGLGSVQYRFVVETSAGASVINATVPSGTGGTAGQGITVYAIAANVLQLDVMYRWRTRAEAGSVLGQWSAYTTFRTPAAPPPPPPRISATRFVAFGDSITLGVLSIGPQMLVQSPPSSYPFKLQVLLSNRYTTQTIDVLDEGVGGERADSGVNRLPRVLSADAPQTLLLMEGINDLNGDGAAAIPTIVDALRSMIRAARDRGIRVFIGTLLPQRPGARRAYSWALVQPANDEIRAMAAREDVVLVDLYEAFGGEAGTLIGDDGLHPNAAGYEKIAETFFEAIRARLEVAENIQDAGSSRLLTAGSRR
jgi:lysophospholipase L1-like esterase